MRYSRSLQFRKADPKKMKHFIGLKSRPYEGRSFVIDEHDAKMVVANLRKKEYPIFKREFKNKPFSSFRVLQDIEYKRKRK